MNGVVKRKTTASDFIEVQIIAGEMYAVFGPLMERYDGFICPTAVSTEVMADKDPKDDDFSINGNKADLGFGWCMPEPFNMLSRCPVLAVSSGIGKNSVSRGIQIVAKTYEDETVFRAAAALEKAQPWMDSADRRPR